MQAFYTDKKRTGHAIVQAHTPKILIVAAGTGGHIIPGLTIAQEAEKNGWQVCWLGSCKKIEQTFLADASFPCYQINLSGIRKKPKELLKLPMKLAYALIQCYRMMKKERPDIVLCMGSFVCGPAGMMAKIMGIPCVLHESNAVVGLANRLLLPLAKKLCLGFPIAKKYKKSVVTGNPVRLLNTTTDVKKNNDKKKIHILILGGSQGALQINQATEKLLNTLSEDELKKISLWQQTGARHFTPIKKALQRFDALRLNDFIHDMPQAYAWADYIISRAGAMSVTELMCVKKPCLLIPYPHAADNHQYHNAQWLVKTGQGIILQENKGHILDFAAIVKSWIQGATEKNNADTCSSTELPDATQAAIKILYLCQALINTEEKKQPIKNVP